METYNPEDYEIVKPGTKRDLIVTGIDRGELKDFIEKEHLDKFKSDPSSPYLKVHLEVADKSGAKDDMLISLPTDPRAVSPASNFGKWRLAFGAFPFVGQQVYQFANAEGYFQFKL